MFPLEFLEVVAWWGHTPGGTLPSAENLSEVGPTPDIFLNKKFVFLGSSVIHPLKTIEIEKIFSFIPWGCFQQEAKCDLIEMMTTHKSTQLHQPRLNYHIVYKV